MNNKIKLCWWKLLWIENWINFNLPWLELVVTLTSWLAGKFAFAGLLSVSRARFCWCAARCIRNCCSIFSLISSGVCLPLTCWSPEAAVAAAFVPTPMPDERLPGATWGVPERLLVIIWALAFSNLEFRHTHAPSEKTWLVKNEAAICYLSLRDPWFTKKKIKYQPFIIHLNKI